MKGWSWRNSKTSLFLKVNRCLHLKQGWAESIVLMLRTEVITRMLHLTRIYLLSAIGLVASHPHCQAPVNTHAHTHTEGTRGLVAKSCPTLANPWTIAHQVPLSISQGRTLEWVAISFSSGSSWLRNLTYVSCIAGGFFTPEPLRKPQNNLLSLWRYLNDLAREKLKVYC